MQMNEIKFEHWPTSRLTPYARNPRKNDHVVDQMAAAITEFGFRIPIIARSTGEVVDGHLRLKAALRLGLETVPVILADDLTPAQIKAFRILANRSATWADWDEDLLRLELEELKLDDFDLALTPMIAHCQGAIYIAMSSSELDTLQSAFRAAGGKWSTFIIWAKNTFTLGRSDYQRQYEPILYGWPEGATRHWCGDRDQGDVWHFNKPRVNDLHPTMKPVELVERAIRNSSRPGDVVLDPFGGSGTTLIAAEKSGRQARLIELDPKYVDVIVLRWQDYAGAQAVRGADGVRFDDLVGAMEATTDTCNHKTHEAVKLINS